MLIARREIVQLLLARRDQQRAIRADEELPSASMSTSTAGCSRTSGSIRTCCAGHRDDKPSVRPPHGDRPSKPCARRPLSGTIRETGCEPAKGPARLRTRRASPARRIAGGGWGDPHSSALAGYGPLSAPREFVDAEPVTARRPSAQPLGLDALERPSAPQAADEPWRQKIGVLGVTHLASLPAFAVASCRQWSVARTMRILSA